MPFLFHTQEVWITEWELQNSFARFCQNFNFFFYLTCNTFLYLSWSLTSLSLQQVFTSQGLPWSGYIDYDASQPSWRAICMACWEEHLWTELLASLPEAARMSSLLPTEKAGDEVRERWEWQVSIPLDGEGERAGLHIGLGASPHSEGILLSPSPGPPAATDTEMAAVQKPCWGHMAWPWQCSLALQAFTESNGSPDSQ